MANSRKFSTASAELALKNKNYQLCLENFFICLYGLKQDVRDRYELMFNEALEGWLSSNPSNVERAISLVPQIYQLFPINPQIRFTILRSIYNLQNPNFISTALDICENALNLPIDVKMKSPFRIMKCNFTTIPFSQWHIKMINDHHRNANFAQVISKSIKSTSDIVIDIGTGTGLLSVIAARLSKNVISIEENPILCKIATEVFKENQCSENIQLQNCNSTAYPAKQKADVIISEVLDCCVFGEQIIDTFLDAHRRFSKSSTIFIPSKASVLIRLFKSESIFCHHSKNSNGKRYRSTYVKTKDNEDPIDPYWCCKVQDFHDFKVLSNPIEIVTADFSNPNQLQNLKKIESFCEIFPLSSSQAHGIVAHFKTSLDSNNEFVIDSSVPSSSWDVGVFPFKEPINVEAGKPLKIKWKIDKNRLDISPVFSSNIIQEYEIQTIGVISQLYEQQLNDVMISQIPSGQHNQILDLTTLIDFGKCLELNTNYKSIDDDEKNLPYTHVAVCLHQPDGSFDSEAFLRLEGALLCLSNIECIIPNRVRIIGRLFCSDRIHLESRPNQSAFCEVELKNSIKKFNLKEYREIRIDEKANDISICSEEFEIMDFHLNVDEIKKGTYRSISKIIEVKTLNSIVDGVLYNFEYCGKRVNNTLATFNFENRVENQEKINVVFDMQEGSILISELNVDN